MEDGNVVKQGPPETIFGPDAEPRLRRFVQSVSDVPLALEAPTA
jgi:polar amino acid transport system permease protein